MKGPTTMNKSIHRRKSMRLHLSTHPPTGLDLVPIDAKESKKFGEEL